MTEAHGPFPVVPLSPVEEEWAKAFAATVLDVDPTADPDRAQAAMRECFRVPRPRDGRDDFEPVPEDVLSQRESDECADRVEARETAQREWRGSDG